MKLSFRVPLAFAALSLFAVRLHAAPAPEPDSLYEVLETVRVENNVTIGVGTGHIVLNETIVLTPDTPAAEVDTPGRKFIVHVLISPLWIKEGERLRPAFQMLRPHLNLSNGRVRRMVLTRPDGETVNSIAAMTPDCRWVLTVELGHVIPRRMTVNVHLSSSSGINSDTEFTYAASNDGQRFRSGPLESHFTILRVRADQVLEPWSVLNNETRLERATSYTVRLERDVNHTIRFGRRAEAATGAAVF